MESKGGDSSDYWKITKLGTPGGLEMELGGKNVSFPLIKRPLFVEKETFSFHQLNMLFPSKTDIGWNSWRVGRSWQRTI